MSEKIENKDRPITIRLTGREFRKLVRLARKAGKRTATFGSEVLSQFIESTKT